ncbi:uncharacterized protein LOC143450623 isoform X2 [Clavelina lepadiformis]|uniref:uncharacterized protein LOC143450623 isoform X2 n=1 Tax=Clavelina lepadiformis TaxID=159417 RepID=UPI004043556D
MPSVIEYILCQHQVVSNVDQDLFNYAVSSTLSFLVTFFYTFRLTNANAGQLKAKHLRSSNIKVKILVSSHRRQSFRKLSFFPTGKTCDDTHESWNADCTVFEITLCQHQVGNPDLFTRKRTLHCVF